MMKKLTTVLILCLVVVVSAIFFIMDGRSASDGYSGWHKTESGMQYRDDSGLPVTGWITENGTSRYLTDGYPAGGWQKISGSAYYLNEDGTPYSGWLEQDGKRYYLRSTGAMVTGWLNLDGQQYYLDEAGVLATVPVEISGTMRIFGHDGKLISGWYEQENGRHYADSNGVPALGWTTIGDKQYYFDENGVMCTGWIEANNSSRYLREDGSMAKGKVMIDNAAHFFSSTGEEFYLVNPWNRLPENYTVKLAKTEFGHRVADYAADELSQMLNDCRSAGHNPFIRSSYRTTADQEMLFQNKINRLVKAGYSQDEARTKAATVVAFPGTSEHQMGLALDIVDNTYRNLDEGQANTATQQWLMENSWKYGFILRYPTDKGAITGIIYEPWHYRYVGKELAAELHELNLCLEEYVDMLTAKAA